MALPAVAAQLINVLYNIVADNFIGHIPGYGDLALTGRRGYLSDHHDHYCIQCICRDGGY